MEKTSRHAELEIRIASLEGRIAALKQKLSKAPPLKKIDDLGEVERLERHHTALKDLLRQLNGEGAGFRQELKAEIETMAEDLSTTVEDYVKWIDSNYHPD